MIKETLLGMDRVRLQCVKDELEKGRVFGWLLRG
jgi:hypothetical protein